MQNRIQLISIVFILASLILIKGLSLLSRSYDIALTKEIKEIFFIAKEFVR